MCSSDLDLLVIIFHILRQVNMQHKTYIRLIHPHAKGNGRHHHHAILLHEGILVGVAIGLCHAGVVGKGAIAGKAQVGRQLLGLLARGAVDDSAPTAAAVEEASGRIPRVYHNDHSRPERPVIRTLEEEVGRVVRSRAVNPKWIAGVRRHGYKGAFEIAATVDYMFAFAATTGAVKSHHFDLAFDAYIGDAETCEFLATNNPAALREIAGRFSEAAARGLWTPRLNSAYDRLRELTA